MAHPRVESTRSAVLPQLIARRVADLLRKKTKIENQEPKKVPQGGGGGSFRPIFDFRSLDRREAYGCMNSQEEAPASSGDVPAGPVARRGPPGLGSGQEEKGACLACRFD